MMPTRPLSRDRGLPPSAPEEIDDILAHLIGDPLVYIVLNYDIQMPPLASSPDRCVSILKSIP